VITNGIFAEENGRLGNQLFWLGLLFAIRQRRGHEFYLPHNGEALWQGFDLDVASDGPDCDHVFHEVDGSCNYDADVFGQPDGTSFIGYFQSYRYLEDCQPALLRFLRFKFSYRALGECILFSYRRKYRRPLVSLNVRRGDYLNPDAEDVWGNLAKDGYYERAVAAIGHDVTYVVVSDDLPWCRQFFDLECVEFADFDPFTSMCILAGCDVNVVANSTFSWWGAYLNPRSEVYAPSRWWRAQAPPNDRQDDIVPPGWRTIPSFACRTSSATQV
jgi:hypothetical protein